MRFATRLTVYPVTKEGEQGHKDSWSRGFELGIVVRFRRHVGHDLRLAVISHQGRVIVETDVVNFKKRTTVVPDKEIRRPRGREDGGKRRCRWS